jgi:hypothetical protein
MKFLAAAVALALPVTAHAGPAVSHFERANSGPPAASARWAPPPVPESGTIRLTGGKGGSLRQFRDQVARVRASGQRVVIDGPLYSAHTLWATLPPEQVCATPRGMLYPHAATSDLTGLPAVTETEALIREYPPAMQEIIRRAGGLTMQPLPIRAASVLPRCR